MSLSASPSSLSFENPSSAPQTSTISGGVAPYSLATIPANAVASISDSTVTVTPTAAGGPDNLYVQDSTTPTPLSVSVAITVTNGALIATPNTMTFANASAAAATTTISGGVGPYSIETAPSSAIATASLSGSVLTVTPVGPGAQSIVIKDSEGTAQTVSIAIVVGPASSDIWPDVRVTIYDAFASEVLCRDAVLAGDLGMDALMYEDTPSGCGAGSLTVNLSYADITARGYYRGYNIVEISTADMQLTAACASGATKIYVDSNKPVDPSTGEDGQQLYMWDGANLTMFIPVTGVGTDSGGNYITIGTPMSTPGNPSTLPAYGAGTLVGRRRYCGRIIRRSRPNQRTPKATMALVGFGATLSAYGTFTITNTDAGVAVYNTLAQFASRWPFLTIEESNFPAIGWNYNGQQTNYSALQMASDICAAIPTGDLWVVRIGHDRTPRLIRVYTEATDSYTYNVTLPQGVTNFEPLNVQVDDEDCSNLYNAVEVVASNTLANQSSNVQPAAIVDDEESIGIYGQVDAQPVYQTGLTTQTDCIDFGTSLLNQNSLAVASNQFRVYVRNVSDSAATIANMPAGFANGDVVRGVDSVTIARFTDTGTIRNMVPDSEFIYGPGQTDAFTWTTLSNAVSVDLEGGESESNALAIAGTGASQTVDVASMAIDVAPGQTLTLSIWINASSSSSGSAQAAVFPSVNGSYYGSAITGSTVTQAHGANSKLTATFTIPPNATYSQVSVVLMTDTAITPSGHSLLFSQPQLEPGSFASSYAQNAAAPSIFGLVSSVQTTIDPRGDRWQDVKFAAIEPDWNAAIAEKTRAMANAILLNSPTPVSISSYCVSVSAYPSTGIPITGLTVSPPTFLAIFAPGDPVVTVEGTNFTLEPTATNWAWLNPNGTWTVNQNPSTVSGAILYAYFQTSATGVLGYTETAPIGVVNIGVGNVNVAADLAAPTCTSITVSNTSTPTTLSSDVEANLTVTNVPQDGSAFGLAYYFRTHGTTAWVPYGEVTFPGLPDPAASITMPAFVYGQMSNGIAYDYAVGFVGIAGYGPLTTIATNVTATPIVVTAPYMIGTTSPTPSVTSVTVTNGISANGIAAAVTLAFTVTNQPTDGSLAWLDVYFRTHGAADYTFYTRVPVPGQPTPSASQAYDVILADITNGQYLDFACKFVNMQGAASTSYGVIYSDWEALALNLPSSALPTVPSGTTLSATGSVTGYQGAGGGAYYAQFTVTPSISSSLPFADWGIGFVIMAKVNNTGSIDGDTTVSDYTIVDQIATNSWSSGALTGVTSALSAGNGHQLAIAAIAQNGKYSNLVPFALATSQNIGSGSIGSLGSGNLIPDSDFNCTNFNASGVGSLPVYWTTYYMDGVTFWIERGPGADGNPSTNRLTLASGGNSRWQEVLSSTISVVPGAVLYFSYFCSATSASGNHPYFAIVAPGWDMTTSSGTIYEQFNVPFAVGTQTPPSWTVPAGIYQIQIVWSSNKTTVSGGATIHIAAPMLSTTQGPYLSGPSTLNSIATTAPVGDSNMSSSGPASTSDNVPGVAMHNAMSAGVQSALNSSGDILNVEWAGGKMQSDGSITNVDGVTSSRSYQTPNGTLLVLEGQIASGTSTGLCGFEIGGNLTSNYYRFLWNDASGLRIVRVSGGSGTVVASASSSPPSTTNARAYRLAIYYNTTLPAVTVEIQVDSYTAGPYLDTSPPPSPSSVSLLVYTGGSAGTLLQNRASTNPTYTEQHPAFKDVITSSGTIPASTALNPQGSMGVVGGIPSSIPYTSTTTSITLNLPAVTLKRADQSNLSVPVPSPQPSWTGLSASHTYYVIAGIDVATQAWTAQLASSAFSGSQLVTSSNQFAADGFIPIFQNAQVSTPASGSGGGSGGGYTPQCPARWQLVETLERGLIRADEICVGMHLPNVGESWVEVLHVDLQPAPIWRYTLEDESGRRESFDVNDTHAVKLQSGEWLRVCDMRGGERVVGARSALSVVEARFLIDDYFVPLAVEGHEFLMGGAVVHNFATL